MATSIFDKKEIVPQEFELKDVLKDSYDTWNYLINYLQDVYGILSLEWKYYSKNSGWCIKVSNEKRNIAFLIPNDDYFIVTINMSITVSRLVLASNISDTIKTIIQKTKPYMEGLSVLIKILDKSDLDNIKTILKIRG